MQPTFLRGIRTATRRATASLATVANQTTILARLGSWTGTGINTVLGAFRAMMAKAAALTPTDISTGTTFDNTTDSAEAIRDRGDAAWVTANVSNLDVAVSSRLASASYTAPPSAAAILAAFQADTEWKTILAGVNGVFTFDPDTGVLVLKNKAGNTTLATLALTINAEGVITARASS